MQPVTSITALMSAAAGASGAYFFDPRLGRRRRARAKDVLDHVVHEASQGVKGALADLDHRARGFMASVGGGPTPHAAHAMDDPAIVARVRSRVGHACTHAHAIQVTCNDGVVELAGPILRYDVQDVLRVTWTTIGVRDVIDHLERHATTEGVPGLAGNGRRARANGRSWAAGTRLLAGSGGALAMMLGLGRGGLLGAGTALAGTAALARALANAPLAGLVGLGEQVVDVAKTTTIHVPVEHVFAFFENPQNFPKLMRRLPGARVAKDLVCERVEPNRILVWKSARGAAIVQTLSVRFESMGPSTTRLDIRLSYVPPGGLLGHEVARLFGADPKHELDEDMLRLKSLLEQGKTTGSSGVVTLEELRHRSQPS